MSTLWSKKLTRALSLSTLAKNCSKVMNHSPDPEVDEAPEVEETTEVESSSDRDAMSWDEYDVAGLAIEAFNIKKRNKIIIIIKIVFENLN